VTLKYVQTSVVKSRPSVPYGPNLCLLIFVVGHTTKQKRHTRSCLCYIQIWCPSVNKL